MVVMILHNVPMRLRGELTRWLLEPQTGIFVGHVNATVRDLLWKKCKDSRGIGGVVQLWTTNTEQHFDMRMAGNTKRRIINTEGLKLIMIPNADNIIES